MHYKRIVVSGYPHVYDRWQTDTATWVIQDLRAEDDELALKLLAENMCPDETLCQIQNLCDEPASVHHMVEFWRECLAQRMSLGCYEVKEGEKTLVGLNVCIAVGVDDKLDLEVKGKKWKIVYEALKYAESLVDPYKYLGLDMLLHALGLVVRREYRGVKMGKRLLAAREPLCKTQGIKGTTTVFTGTASQKLAASSGFETLSEVSIRDLAEAGLPYPKDDDRTIKHMVKKFAY